MMELKNLAQAKIKALSALEPLRKDATNPHFHQKYSSLAAVLDVVQPAYNAAGIAIFEGVTSMDGTVTVEVTLCHAESGESVTHQLPMPIAGNNAQAVGSAITYGRRYLLMTMCGVAPEDDDGEAAVQAQRTPARQPKRPTVTPSTDADWDGIPGAEEGNGNGNGAAKTQEAMPDETMRKRFHAVGGELYGEHWDAKRGELVHAITKSSKSSKDLTAEQMSALITGMEDKLVPQRNAVLDAIDKLVTDGVIAATFVTEQVDAVAGKFKNGNSKPLSVCKLGQLKTILERMEEVVWQDDDQESEAEAAVAEASAS